MFDQLRDLYQVDWRIFMDATGTWLGGRNPYGPIGRWGAGAFAYPPTALPWLALFVPLGTLGFYVWTMLELAGWWMLIRRHARGQLQLLLWAPLLGNLVGGQSTLAVVLALWAATRASRRGFGWGIVLAWALTKPQVAILPVLWLLWQDRGTPSRLRLAGGIVVGTAALALPATLWHPGIWLEWLTSLQMYRGRILQMAPWQGWGSILLVMAAILWWRSRAGGWQWWLAAGLFPAVSTYAIVTLLPVLRPRANLRTIGGLGLAGILQGPMTPLTLPLILAGQLVAAGCLAGGVEYAPPHLAQTS